MFKVNNAIMQLSIKEDSNESLDKNPTCNLDLKDQSAALMVLGLCTIMTNYLTEMLTEKKGYSEF